MNVKHCPPNRLFLNSLCGIIALLALSVVFQGHARAEANQSSSVITIDADADAYVTSLSPSDPMGATDASTLRVEAISTLFSAQSRSLLHFDLSKIPAGSVINKAELRLFQTGANNDWLLNIDRVEEAWAEATVTFRTAPKTSTFYFDLAAPLTTKEYISWDVTTLAQQWLHQPLLFPNHGLQVRGNTIAAANLNRNFESREASNPPQLVIDFTPPPSSIVVPFVDSVAKLDAQCTSEEYKGAYTAQYIDLGGYVGTVYLKQDNDSLFACIMGVRGSTTFRSFGLYLDRNNGQEKYAANEDYWLQAFIPFAQTASYTGTSDSVNTWQSATINGWTAAAVPGVILGNTITPDVAEFQLPLSMVSTTCGQPFGIALYHQDINDNGVTYGFPIRIGPQFPNTWVQATLERPNCPIRVCKAGTRVCAPASNATVFDANSDTPYAVDVDGYVQNRSQILDGTPLWAVLPVEETTNFTRYDTSGDPLFVGAASVDAGETVLIVTPQRPLQVQNLTLSSEWYVEGDAAKKAWLEGQLQAASNYLYKFSNRQFALGTVTIQQSFDGWSDSQVRLHLNNVFQPRAVIGGIVPTTTIDPSPAITITYNPGKINIGSYWNRYGKPPGQEIIVNGSPVLTSTIQDDWALAMAHELSHHLLYLFDTYVDLNGQQTDSCVGSAMGDTYNPLNHGYIFSPDLWEANCKQTIAYNLLQGRYEWNTIQRWYQWVQPPSAILSGTVRPPVNLTTVTFVAPSTPAGTPASGNIFDLGYRDNETTSGEARAFIYRNGRLLEQGKPAKNTTKLELHDPQVTDRLCVYDINDHAEGTETTRHQFGCEEIALGDTSLAMTKNVAWNPLVTLHQSDSNVLQIAVSQTVPNGTVVKAVLYPEYEQAISTIDLTAVGGGLLGTFVLTQPVPPAYVQLFVDEAAAGDASRREVVVDRGTGGGGAFGPAKFHGGVLIISSDGQASYEPGTPLNLNPGESISWQSMPVTPVLPEGSIILGQSYQLDAFPTSLAESGNVKIQFQEPTPNPDKMLAIYFWNGVEWQRLPTSFTTPIANFHFDSTSFAHTQIPDGLKVAVAPSQSVGVYAILESPANKIFLPFVQR